MFDPVDPKQSFPALEQGILAYWRRQATFRQSLRDRKDAPIFRFYDGPPFATGLPHYGHLLAGTIKDVIPRYQTMRGKYVERRFGWDCHGLPIENLIEKEHNIGSKQDIERMGVAAFNDLCRTSVQRYTKEWKTVVERMGRWVDMDWDYRTMDAPYMESIWWVFSELWKKGLVYEGHKPMHVCPRCVTPLSNFEVTQGYKDVTDATGTVMFRLEESKETEKSEGTYILAWTTTPWTLPGNLFLAVHPETSYVRVNYEGKTLIVAKDLVEKVFKDKEHEVTGKAFKGKTLIGKAYAPLFPYYAQKYGKVAFRIVGGEFVTTEDGTGIVHIAPGFGEDDYNVGKNEGIDPPLQHVTMEGKFLPEVTEFAGQDVKPKDDPSKTDRKIIEWLEKNGRLFNTESYRHSYPHCWRCDSPLLNYATSSWFVRVEKIKEDILLANKQTEWVPSHLRDGRFGKWLEGARDWAVSRNRYWGTPLPIWISRETGDTDVITGRDDLMQHKKIRFTKVTVMRHSESEGNVQGIYQGAVPGTNLTERGRQIAEQTAAQMKEQGVDIIYCSPLARTQQTAEIVAKMTGARVIVDERLREVGFGSFDNTLIHPHYYTAEEDLHHLTEQQRAEHAKIWQEREHFELVEKRTAEFLKEVLPRHRSEHVVVVSHGDPIVMMRRFFTGEDLAKLMRQPEPAYAAPEHYYWDHAINRPLDLHKEFVDDIAWPGSEGKSSVAVTLVRHGETDWNKESKIQGGEADIALNDTGRNQAKECGEKLKGKSYDVIISSPLMRAKETAIIIAKELGGGNIETWDDLRERMLGDWSGKKEDELKNHPDMKGNRSFHYDTPENGESLSAFLLRLEGVYKRLLQEYPGKRVLIVAHRGVLQGLRTVTENLSFDEGVESKAQNGDALEISVHPLLTHTPEVLDCWFESGSMPYAETNFPFRPGSAMEKNGEIVPVGFPADFIAEGIDQTRGWFYTLTVLAGALYKSPAFEHCVVNGTVLAEDGRKMSKRLKNYPDPLEVVEKYGADGLRFALMSSPAVRAEDLRFSERTVEESLRAIILPLWNAYSFFVTYANAAKFEPTGDRRRSSHPLDRWIIAETQDLTNRMTEQLDTYDLSATCAELHDTIDALTNWYIRLSRRRFAGKDMGEELTSEDDQMQALDTLHEVLLTFCQLLAPFCPFVTEAIYQNLVTQKGGSVHLTDWPLARPLAKEEAQLLQKTRMLRQIVSLGLKVRSEKKIRVRQPIAQVTVAVPPEILKEAVLSQEDVVLIEQELNVKKVVFTEDAGELGTAIAMVDARKVGPRLGKHVQEVIAAGKRGEFERTPEGAIVILDEALSPDEVTITYQGREGQDIAGDRGIVVSLDTRVTPELLSEGLARDLIRTVQRLRKEQGLSMTDTIELEIDGLPDVVALFGPLIAAETGATMANVADGPTHEADIEGHPVRIRFRTV